MNKQKLIELSSWVTPSLQIKDKEHTVEFHIQDAFNYHGYDAVGGVVLGFRLLQKALKFFEQACGYLPERRQISLVTAFPGLGARDCFELVTRMVSGNRIKVDASLDYPSVAQGVEGRFYFEFHFHEHVIRLSPIPGAPDDTFIQLGKASKKTNVTPEELEQWKTEKYKLANALLLEPPDRLIRSLP